MRNSLKIAIFPITYIILLNSCLFASLTAKQIYQKMSKGVVLIIASQEGGLSSIGTGSIISEKGLIITNNHVVTNEKNGMPFEKIGIFLKPENLTGNKKNDLKKFYEADVLSRAEEYDLALLRIKGKLPADDFTVLELGDVSDIVPGDEGVAIGHPEKGGLWTLTKGIISNRFVDYKGIDGWNVFQMETNINRGNSGGPLFDIRGYIIGINTMMARKSSDGLAITGINFAVMASTVKNWLEGQGTKISYGKQKYEDTNVANAPEPGIKKNARNAQRVSGSDDIISLDEKETNESYNNESTDIDSRIKEPYSIKDEPEEKEPEQKPDIEKELEQEALNIKTTGDVKKGLSLKAKTAKRKANKIHMDLNQKKRPYTMEELVEYYSGLKKRVEGALDELDKQIKK